MINPTPRSCPEGLEEGTSSFEDASFLKWLQPTQFSGDPVHFGQEFSRLRKKMEASWSDQENGEERQLLMEEIVHLSQAGKELMQLRPGFRGQVASHCRTLRLWAAKLLNTPSHASPSFLSLVRDLIDSPETLRKEWAALREKEQISLHSLETFRRRLHSNLCLLEVVQKSLKKLQLSEMGRMLKDFRSLQEELPLSSLQ